jgi:3-hydroxyisobutyrate dehydrogenase-like beta-hydroxyacid dehydrogenase
LETPDSAPAVGFVGIGVMGEPMAANFVRRSGRQVFVYDVNETRLAQVTEAGALRASDLAELSDKCDVIFLSLPDASAVASVVLGPNGLAELGRSGQTVVDLSTSRIPLAQEISERLLEKGVSFLDAPVSRTQSAAVAGTLAITVGARDRQEFEQIEPLLRCIATDITYCGKPGAGTLVKLLNNLIVFETVVALSEAITVARRSGLIGDELFFDALGRGSAGSFALENHGRKSLLPDTHPTGLFSANYMLKDIGYALDYAKGLGVAVHLGDLAWDLLERTVGLGHGDRYHTAVVKVTEFDSSTAGKASDCSGQEGGEE